MNLYQFFYGKKFWLVRHATFWLALYLGEFLEIIGALETEDPFVFNGQFIAALLFDVFMVYFNFYYLIPKFFRKGTIDIYIALTLSILFANILITEFLIYPCEECVLFSSVFSTMLYTAGLLGIAIAIKISKITYLRQQRLHELQQLQLTTELNYLKKQVNPHFLFNILNNIYVLSRESPKDVPEIILKLSDLMRYQTYDAAKKRVSLNQEMDFINKYLALEKLRRSYLQMEVHKEGDLNNIAIPPLLFLPFVENACKHSTGIDELAETIVIVWKYEVNRLIVRIENTVGRRSGHITDDEYSGFGLKNIRKRIKLLYGKQHDLSIKEEFGWFKVRLVIENIKK